MEIDAAAHDAWGDILVLQELFWRLFQRLMQTEGITHDQAKGRMIEITHNPAEVKKFTFGKHKGEWVADVAIQNRSYLEWLYKEKLKDEEPDEDWLFRLEKHLN